MEDKIRTSTGVMKLSICFEKVKNGLEGNNVRYDLSFSLLKHLPILEKRELAELIYAHTQKFPHLYERINRKYLRRRVLQILGLPIPPELCTPPKGKKKKPVTLLPPKPIEKVLAVIYNDGKHVYMGNIPQAAHNKPNLRKMYFIPYREFCGNGGYIFGCIKLQHLGHLYGIHGGRAELRLSIFPHEWQIKCEPNVLYTLVEGFCYQKMYERRVMK